MHSKHVVFSVFLSFMFLNCAIPEEQKNDIESACIKVNEDRFVDKHGREVIFNGLNVVNKNPDDQFIPTLENIDLDRFEKWGVNLVRLGINWSALEPEPFTYDEQYLQRVQDIVDIFGKHGIYVILDMHQDLYGQKFDNGAPLWATLDEGQPHVTGDIWSDAYLLSPAVQTAFDNFWKNMEVPGGTGLQNHYAAAWAEVASWFAGHPAIIGYDLMNEPFIGTEAVTIFATLLKNFAAIYSEKTETAYAESEIIEIWGDVRSRMEALQYFDDVEAYARLLADATPIHQAFEREKLQPFYQLTANAIREKDPYSILFLEHGYFSNIGITTGINCVETPDGNPDKQCVYAPHAYDLVTDTEMSAEPGFNRLTFIYEKLAVFRETENIPVLIGEWGAYYGGQNEAIVPAAKFSIQTIDENRFSHTYWSYFGGLQSQPYFKQALLRPVVQAVSGRLKSSGMINPDTFKVRWEENPKVNAPTRIFLPGSFDIEEIIFTTSKSLNYQIEPTIYGSYIYIEPAGGAKIHEIHISSERQ